MAEGVETLVQARALTELGCTFLQGYHFGRPGPLPRSAAHGAQAPVA
ncbi:hypothetical protein ACFSC4_29735 [Deinococcus malanensis]